MAEEFVEGVVNLRNLQAKRAAGWEPIPGDGPSGLAMDADSVRCRMPKKKFDAMQERRRTPYNALRDRIEAGQAVVTNSPGPGATIESVDPSEAGGVKRLRRAKGG